MKRLILPLSFIVYGIPKGFVHQTQADRWKKRPCVLAYRAWCDEIRKAAGITTKWTLTEPVQMRVVAYLPMPASWSKKRREEMRYQAHGSKPDASNLLKAVEDALFTNDQMIYRAMVAKFWMVAKCWADEGGPRIDVKILRQYGEL